MSEAQPDAISELFQRDPLSLSQQDIHRIVVELREKRALWEKEKDYARKAGKKPNPRSLNKEELQKKLDLLDIKI